MWCGHWSITFVVLFLFGWSEVSSQQFRYNKELSKEVTTLLDSLLSSDKYDRRLRPDFRG